MPDQRGRLLAHYYDLEYHHYDLDLDFYVQYAIALEPDHKLPILELGCGTGRIAMALAEAGFRVVCVDTSQAMLDICVEKARARGVGSRITPVHADMRDLSGVPTGPYNLAFCALNTFAYLISTTEQRAMLEAVRPLLVQHGVLILDLTPPWPELLPPSNGEIIHQGTYSDSSRAIVHKLVTGVTQPSNQTHHVTLFYDHEAPDGALTRTTQSLVMRWTGRYEMELLLKLCGYTLEKLYGGYDLEEFKDGSERMIFLART